MRTEIRTTAAETAEAASVGDIPRPSSFTEFVGQRQVAEQLSIAVTSAKIRKAPVDHILFYGPPGLGKTTLSYIVSAMQGGNVVCAVGSNIEKAGDIASALAALSPFDCLFIDEIHRMNIAAEEVLYSAMEDGHILISVGQGQQTRQLKIDLPPFTLIGATTRMGMLSGPLRDRFPLVCKLDYYDEKDLSLIAASAGKGFGFDLSEEEAAMIASASRGTPRLVNQNIRRVRDYAYAKNNGKCNVDVIKKALALSGIRANGLNDMDVRILRTLYDSDRPVGLSSLSHILGEDPQTIEEVYEPYLIMKKYVVKTPRGRVIGDEGARYMLAENIREGMQ